MQDLSEMSFAQKKKMAKQIGLKVAPSTKQEQLDQMLRDAMPQTSAAKPEASADVGRGSEMEEFPGPPAKPRAWGAKPKDIQQRDNVHERQTLLWKGAKVYYENYAKEPYPAKPRGPRREDFSSEDEFQTAHTSYKQAKKWWYTVDTVYITLTKSVGIGGQRRGPGKNIPVTREQRDEINRHFSRKQTLELKLLTGNTQNAASYFDHVMNPAVQDAEVH